MISFRWKENEILTFDEGITTIISRRIHNYDNQTKYFIARVVATVRRGERETKKCEEMGLNVKRQHADVFYVHTWTAHVACRTSELIVMRNPEDGREIHMTSMEKSSPRLAFVFTHDRNRRVWHENRRAGKGILSEAKWMSDEMVLLKNTFIIAVTDARALLNPYLFCW